MCKLRTSTLRSMTACHQADLPGARIHCTWHSLIRVQSNGCGRKHSPCQGFELVGQGVCDARQACDHLVPGELGLLLVAEELIGRDVAVLWEQGAEGLARVRLRAICRSISHLTHLSA